MRFGIADYCEPDVCFGWSFASVRRAAVILKFARGELRGNVVTFCRSEHLSCYRLGELDPVKVRAAQQLVLNSEN